MRKLMIVVLLAVAVLAACGGDDEGDTAEPETETETSAPAGNDVEEPQDEFVIIDGGGELAITESCVDNTGSYKGEVEGGGLFILRGGDAPQESFVDFQPSADADPLSSQSAEDTVLTAEGTITTGTTTVTTEDGANSLELQFALVIEDVDPTC